MKDEKKTETKKESSLPQRTETMLAAQLQERLIATNEQLSRITKRLSDAEDVIRFYSTPMNWVVIQNESDTISQEKIKDDFDLPSNPVKVHIGGKRARHYFSKYDNEE